MKLILSTHNMPRTDEIEAYIQSRLGKLEHLDHQAVEARVYLEHDRVRVPDKQYKCAVRLGVPGPDLFAEQWGGELFTTIDMAFKKIQEQVRRRREKLTVERQNQSARLKRRVQNEQLR